MATSTHAEYAYEAASPDTTVNYCALMHAGYNYGQAYALRKRQVAPEFMIEFNSQWSEVFNVPLYQEGIASSEFTVGSRFSEGNHASFPPSSLYPGDIPDTYMTFHLAKEIGMVQSPGFRDCPSCVDQSIAKVGAYLAVTPLEDIVAVHWPYLNTIPRIRTADEVDTLWQHLQCIFTDSLVDPKRMEPPGMSAPEIQCQDTIFVKSAAEIAAVFDVRWPGCSAAGTSQVNTPQLVLGKAGKRKSVYRIGITARAHCGTTAYRNQYVVLHR